MTEATLSKTCSQCGQHKPLDQFYRYSEGKHGRRAACKACCYVRYGESWRERAKQWGRDNGDKNRSRARAWEKANPERRQAALARLAAWREKNPERMLAVDRAHCGARQGARRGAMPKWATMFFIREAYDLARLRTEIIGFPWHVDHVVPLRSKIVSGLHVEHNLAVIPGEENARKRNLHWPDMP